MDIVPYFQSKLSADEIILDKTSIESRSVDWRGRYQTNCRCILRPKSVKSVQTIMRIAHQNHITVTPQGGNTSLCGGSIPSVDNSVIVVLERLSRVRNFNILDKTITVEAGMVLANLQNLVAEQGFYFPLSLASEGSCQIGGNIACNAGGVNVLRYGTMRDLVLGLEVVLPTGDLVSHLSSLHKNTTGTDTKHLWIGSEGTLGIITAATLKIYVKPCKKITLLIGCDHIAQVLILLKELQYRYMNELTTFEYLDKTVFQLSQNFSKIFFDLDGNDFVLCELSFNEENIVSQENLFNHLVLLGFSNTIVASSNEESEAMWKIRENISEAQRHELGIVIKHDIAVPISALQEFIEKTEIKIKLYFPDAKILLFGHFGDGSLHYNVALGTERTSEVYRFEKELNKIVYTEVIRYSGTIAAEHGIGQLKREWLPLIRTKQEIAIMKYLKHTIDPHHIMNPGKILPD